MRIISFMLCSLIIMSVPALALRPAVIGGIRDGLALGIMADSSITNTVGIRFGLEANTGKTPILMSFGGKFYLVNLGRRVPMSLGIGMVGYFGNSKSELGASLSFIFDNIFDVKPLFAEVGIDIAGNGKLQAQIGYKL